MNYCNASMLTRIRHKLIELIAGNHIVILNAKLEIKKIYPVNDKTPLLSVKSDNVMLCNVEILADGNTVYLSRWSDE